MPAANTALTSSPTGIATLKPAWSWVKRTPVVPSACSPMKPPVAMNASESSRTRASPRRFAASPAAKPRANATAADDPEDDEVRAVVLEVRVELLTQQQRDEPDERQRSGDHPDDDNRRRARAVPRCGDAGLPRDRRYESDPASRIGGQDDRPSSSRTILRGSSGSLQPLRRAQAARITDGDEAWRTKTAGLPLPSAWTTQMPVSRQ